MAQAAIKGQNASKRLYTIKELVTYFGATDWFWRNQIWAKKLPVVKVGNKQLVDRLDIEAFITNHKSFA